MTFIGWIELETKSFSVGTVGEDIQVEKYTGGSKVMGSRRVMSRSDFRAFVKDLDIDRELLPKAIQDVLNI